jgi:peptide/nickel transport system ATP-binding protein
LEPATKTSTALTHAEDTHDTAEPLLSVRNLSVAYRSSKGKGTYVKALRNISFDVRPGETLGLLGESGAGKSTVASAIMALVEQPDKITGEIIYGGRNVLKLRGKELRDYRWIEASMIFQAAMNSLDPVVTVGKSFDELLVDKGLARGKANARELAKKLLRDMDLSDKVCEMYPFELSGGMKQRVIIAMALATHPKILLLDEPTTALDSVTQFGVLSTLKILKRGGHLQNLILITHDPSVHAFMVDRLIVMLKGAIVEDGPTQEVMTRPKHPYTQLLLGALPLAPKRGSISDKSEDNACPFTRYCPYVMQKCRQRMPKLYPAGQEQSAACFLYGGA